MLDYETDTDTHFQCPQCGQKGSVPNATLEKALAATPHVQISCSSCAHKFEPFTAPDEATEEATEETTQEMGAANDAALPALASHWQDSDTDTDATESDKEGDGSEGNGEASLPGWLMPATEVKRGSEAPEENEAPEQPADDATESEAQDPTEDAPVEEEEAEEKDEEAQAEPEELAQTEEAPEAEAAEEMAEAEEIDETDQTDEVEEADLTDLTEVAASIDADTDTDIDADTDTDSEAESALEKAPEPADDLPNSDAAASVGEAADLAAENSPNDAPPASPAQAAQAAPSASPFAQNTRSPIGVVNGLLLILVLVLMAANIFVLFDNAPRTSNIRDNAPRSAAASGAVLNVVSADFTVQQEAGQDARLTVEVRFQNPGTQDGMIGDFRINLQNEARETLTHWVVVSRGIRLAAGDSRAATSVLVAPPANIAHVAIDYPLLD